MVVLMVKILEGLQPLTSNFNPLLLGICFEVVIGKVLTSTKYIDLSWIKKMNF